MNLRVFGGLLLCAALLVPVAARAAEEDPAEAALREKVAELGRRKAAVERELPGVEARLVSNDSLMKLETTRGAALEQRLQQDLERRRKELQGLGAKRDSLQGAVQAERGRQALYQNRIKESEARERAIGTRMAERCRELEVLIAAGIPTDQDRRLERVQALRRDLEAGKATPDEGLVRLLAMLRDEVRFGDEVSLTKVPVVRLDGQTVNAQLLRIGAQGLAYMDDEQKHYGVMDRVTDASGKVGWKWREELDFTEREMVRVAIEVKSAKRPPQVVELPMRVEFGRGEVKPATQPVEAAKPATKPTATSKPAPDAKEVTP
jgi:hypothetical protein